MTQGKYLARRLGVVLSALLLCSPGAYARIYQAGSVLPGAVPLQEALAVAGAGDTILVEDGVYPVVLQPVRGGTDELHRLVIKAKNPGRAVILVQGKVVRLETPWVTLDGLVLDGGFGAADCVDIRGPGAHHFELKRCEVRNTLQDGIDIEGAPAGRILDCTIHHCLAGTHHLQHDGHGIVAGNLDSLLIRNCNIYFVSGDCFQSDPDRDPWDNIVLENCRLWTGPLPEAAAGFPAGYIPGENAVDTKQLEKHPRSRLTLRNVQAYGWRAGLIGTMSAFNIKDHVEVLIENCVLWDNEVCLRLRGGEGDEDGRGGARVAVINTVMRESDYGIRYEDMIRHLKIYNCTWGNRVDNPFGVRQGLDKNTFEMRNCLFQLERLPAEAAAFKSNLTVGPESFGNPRGGDFRLVAGSPAIDAGEDLSVKGVTSDAASRPRPSGRAYDIGAYEF
ncbi:MAG: right-handed parallel beta-helix repeat-containing protein [Candidatus Glassbacteria bacterium]|nr:right-handed parallel beta-helix repeat-containing protein [Candidatus Glassbacteria bacterium]